MAIADHICDNRGTDTDSRPWLSILIPVYNVAPYLPACLESIVSQLPEGGVEIILLDDVSTDRSRAICDAAHAEHPQAIRVFAHDSNRGLSAARNSLLDLATGEYVWFVDSDDEITLGSISALRNVVTHHRPEVILCDYEKNGKEVSSFAGSRHTTGSDPEALVRGIFASRRMHSWSKIALRSLWADDLRFPVGRCFEDIATTPLLALRARSFYYAGAAWIRYRVRSDSITGIMSRTKGKFDVGKNDDLAVALTGFVDAADRQMPHMSAATRYCIGQFWAKEFTKIGWRLLSSRMGRDSPAVLLRELSRYRTMMDGQVPTPFSRLANEHLRRGMLGRWIVLGIFLALARNRQDVKAGGRTPLSPKAKDWTGAATADRSMAFAQPGAGLTLARCCPNQPLCPCAATAVS